jgi:nardilysin
MRLVVVGAYSLDDLQDMVVQYYSDIPALPRNINNNNNNDDKTNGHQHLTTTKTITSWDDSSFHDGRSSSSASLLQTVGFPFAKSSLSKLYRIIPVKDRHNLSITWQLPSQQDKWKTKPCDYIAHLLGHEAQGSLLSCLKKKSWVTTCVAGAGHDGMEVSITPTYII